MITIFPKLISAAAENDMAHLSLNVRRIYSNRKPPQISIKEIVANIGFDFHSTQNHSSIYVKDKNGVVSGELLVKQSSSWNEQFATAHLLGHFFLQILPKVAVGSWNDSGMSEDMDPYERFVSGTYKSMEDQKADHFAKEFLLPTPMLEKAKTLISDDLKLAKFFNVHPEFIIEEPAKPQTKHQEIKKPLVQGMARIRELARKLDKPR